MKKKTIYGIGTGPGDKEYLTLKAVRIMETASVIFAPNNKGKNMALDTARDFIEGKKLVLIDFPMGRVTREDYIDAAKIIYREIPEGQHGAFLTIGDPMVYSTYIYIMDELSLLYDDIDMEIVSGIPSFIAAAGRTMTPLTEKGDDFLLCDDFNEEKLKTVDSIAILKTINNKEEILRGLDKAGFDYSYIKRVSLDEEEIFRQREDILGDRDYISLIIGRRKNAE